jgi:glycine dehydrogenase subunit 1
MSLLGKSGLRRLAEINVLRAQEALRKLREVAEIETVFSGPCFNEFVMGARDVERLFSKCAANKIVPGIALKKYYPELPDGLLVCVTEMNEGEEIERFVAALTE